MRVANSGNCCSCDVSLRVVLYSSLSNSSGAPGFTSQRKLRAYKNTVPAWEKFWRRIGTEAPLLFALDGQNRVKLGESYKPRESLILFAEPEYFRDNYPNVICRHADARYQRREHFHRMQSYQ